MHFCCEIFFHKQARQPNGLLSAFDTAQQPRVQTLPQPLCLTPPSTSLLASGSTCVSPFELDKRRPRSAGGEPHDENADGSNKKSSDDATEDPLSSKLESEYHAFADSLLI